MLPHIQYKMTLIVNKILVYISVEKAKQFSMFLLAIHFTQPLTYQKKHKKKSQKQSIKLLYHTTYGERVHKALCFVYIWVSNENLASHVNCKNRKTWYRFATETVQISGLKPILLDFLIVFTLNNLYVAL